MDHLADLGQRKSPLLFGCISVSHVGQPEQPDDSEEVQDVGLMDDEESEIGDSPPPPKLQHTLLQHTADGSPPPPSPHTPPANTIPGY